MKVSRVSDALPCYARVNNDDCFDKIQELLNVFTETQLSALLGIKRYALHRRNQPIPVVRLAFLLWRLMLKPREPLSLFEVITCGKYERGMPQGAVEPVEDWTI